MLNRFFGPWIAQDSLQRNSPLKAHENKPSAWKFHNTVQYTHHYPCTAPPWLTRTVCLSEPGILTQKQQHKTVWVFWQLRISLSLSLWNSRQNRCKLKISQVLLGSASFAMSFQSMSRFRPIAKSCDSATVQLIWILVRWWHSSDSPDQYAITKGTTHAMDVKDIT